MPPPVLIMSVADLGQKPWPEHIKLFSLMYLLRLLPHIPLGTCVKCPACGHFLGGVFGGFSGVFSRLKCQKSEVSSGHGPSCKSWISSSQAHLAQGEPRGQTTGENRSSVKIMPKSTKQSGTPSHSQSSEGIVTQPCKYQPPGGAL